MKKITIYLKKLLTMENQEKILRKIIRKNLQEMNDISESDLLVRAGVDWDEAKPEFLEKVNNLISKIDDDQYDDADDLIGSVITALRFWRHKIRKGQDNGIVNRTLDVATLDEEGINEIVGGEWPIENKRGLLQNIKTGIKGLIIGGFDKEKLKSMITTLIDNPESI